MFTLREFIKEGFIKAVGQMPDYKIILNSAGWLDKGVLLEEDLEEINQAIEDSHKEPEPETTETIEEELLTNQNGEEEMFDEGADYGIDNSISD